MGAPSNQRDLTAARKKLFIEELERHGIIARAARAASPHSKKGCVQSFYDERERNPDFAAAWDEAMAQAKGSVEHEVHRRAVEGYEEPIYGGQYKEKIVGTVRKYSDRLPLFQLLASLDPELRPEACKIHLAVHNGIDDPLDVYVAGDFDRWQAWQTKPNFNRENVLALIKLPERDQWLLAGVYHVNGCTHLGERHFDYDLEPSAPIEPLAGRVVVEFQRSGRQSYLVAENWTGSMSIAEIRPEPMRVADFPGYSKALLTKSQLDVIVRQQVASWRAALGSVAGVYVITDRNAGKLYVGSASGGEGIWSRWCSYSATGHGGNRELIQLLSEKGADYAEYFQFGILEIADHHADILGRESHWKQLLGTRSHGYNSN